MIQSLFLHSLNNLILMERFFDRFERRIVLGEVFSYETIVFENENKILAVTLTKMSELSDVHSYKVRK